MPVLGSYVPSNDEPVRPPIIEKPQNVELPDGQEDFNALSKVLDSLEDRTLNCAYANAIQLMPSQRDATFSGMCIVLGCAQNFDNCNVLNDQQFLHGN